MDMKTFWIWFLVLALVVSNCFWFGKVLSLTDDLRREEAHAQSAIDAGRALTKMDQQFVQQICILVERFPYLGLLVLVFTGIV
jgi:hypothetical protein